jgi:tetratricopeptide (TPR) repeat protein
MNRKDRRAAGKQGKGFGPAPPPGRPGVTGGMPPMSPAAHHFAAAARALSAGAPAEAERHCRDLLRLEPDHADGLHLLGIIACQAGQHAAGAELMGRALARSPRNADCHFNLAFALRALGRLDEAAAHFGEACSLRRDYTAAFIAHGDVLAQQGRLEEAAPRYQRALALDPRSVDALHGLGNVAMQQGRLDEAASAYRRVLALKPDFAEACNNLGVVLAGQGKFDEAIAQYRRAITLKPALTDVYRNLGRLILAQGDVPQALALARTGLYIAETDDAKMFFVTCVRRLANAAPSAELTHLIARALAEGWSRTGELSSLAANLFKLGATGAAAVGRVAAAWPRQLSAQELWPADELARIAADRLLRALMEAAPVQDIALERTLTAARAALIGIAEGADTGNAVADDVLRFFCALARQCFINEYVFAETAAETGQVQQLQGMLTAALATDAPAPVLWPVALASYRPLHALPPAQALLQRRWPEPVSALFDQQIREPLRERQLRATIPALTPIEDAVSRTVREQYEEMPYPRWVKAAPVAREIGINWYLRNQFPLAPLRSLAKREPLDVLIAGCGTGQHSIETARRFAGARVLAVDLSLASLSYATRKTQSLRLANIDYAQADLLQLGKILGATGRSFDLIEASGVLHHLADPAAGWRVLLSLLRPGGVMHVGLYSALARADIRAARAFIAERGYGRTAADIRQCRQDLLAAPDGTPLKNVTQYPDFFTISECRDLLFHVQEHQLTIPEIAAFLRANALTFLGFANAPTQAYRARFSADPAMTDLACWHAFETENPLTFVNMYQFWVQKPAAGV